MSDDPAHKAMLYFLEILMNSNGALSISQLAGRFGSRSFSSEMRTACGGNEAGLKKFLLKFPSLFTVQGNAVSLCDGKTPPDYSANGDDDDRALRRRSLPDVSLELEAVSFFQGKLAKKEERWVNIKSLAGHLSQANAEVRNVVGPQLQFRAWLLKHPHIFDVQGELVGLRDGISAMSTSTIPRKAFDSSGADLVRSSTALPPKTPPAQRRFPPKSPSSLRRSRSFGDRLTSANHINSQPDAGHGDDFHSSSSTARKPPLPASKVAGTSGPQEPITMTANEYKAVMFLKESIEKGGGSLRVIDIASSYGATSDPVRTTIGWTRAEQEEFVQQHRSIFVLTPPRDGAAGGSSISLVKNTKLNVIITSGKPAAGSTGSPPQLGPPQGAIHSPALPSQQQQQPQRTVNTGKGVIFHVAKLWGIIDLGKHEHVFFDKSIMRRQIDDLTRYFQPGDVLGFQAVLAPKTSRAKWRATHVWKEVDQLLQANMSGIGQSGSESDLSNSGVGGGSIGEMNLLSPALSVEEEINKFLPTRRFHDYDATGVSGAGRDANTSGDSLAGSDSSLVSPSPKSKRLVKNATAAKCRDAAPSGAGVVPIYNFHRDSESESGSDAGGVTSGSNRKSLTLVPESYQMSESSLHDITGEEYRRAIDKKPLSSLGGVKRNGVDAASSQRVVSTDARGRQFADACCQTVSTGDVIATQLYYES